MSTRLLATNAFWSLLNHLLSRGSLMLGSILLARALSPPAFAAYSYFQLTVFMIAAYASLGLGVTASRYFAEVGHPRDGRPPPPLGMLCAMSLLLACAGVAAVYLLPSRWLDAGLPVPRWTMALGVFAVATGAITSSAVVGLERLRAASLVSAAATIVMLAGAWAAGRRHSAAAGMLVLVLALSVQVVGELLVVAGALGRGGAGTHLALRREDARRVFEFAGPMLLVSLVYASGSWLLGRLILDGQGGEHAFALYSIGLQWFSLALVLPAMLSRVVLPRIVREGGGNPTGVDARRLTRNGALLATGAAALMTAAGLAFGPWLLAIYGGQYSAGRWFIGAFMAAAMLTAPANMIGNAIVVNDGQVRWLTLTVVWMVVLLVVGFASHSAGAWSGAIAQATAALVLTASAVLVARTRRLI